MIANAPEEKVADVKVAYPAEKFELESENVWLRIRDPVLEVLS